MSSAAKRGLLILLIGFVIMAGALGYEYFRLSDGRLAASEGGAVSATAIGGPFELTDQFGKIRHPEDFRGKLMLVYFGFTFCADVCPTELQTITQALDQLGPKAASVQPLFITVDPGRDTVEQMKSYAESFHPSLLALTGSEAQVAAAAKAYKVFYRKVQPKDGTEYLVDHSSFLFVMDRQGRYLTHFGVGVTAEALAAALNRQL